MANPRRLLLEILFTRPLQRFFILFSSLLAAGFGIASPFFQKEFIDTLTGQRVSSFTPFEFLIFSFVSLILYLGFTALSFYLGAKESLVLQRQLSQKLYSKVLDLRADSMQGRQVGEFVGVYATDVPGATIVLEQLYPQGASILFPLILAPVALVVVFHLPMIPMFILMFCIVLFNFTMAFRQSHYFSIFKRLAADRIALVSEWVQNLRSLRILGWIESFEKKMFRVRRIETANRVAMVTNGQIMNSVNSSITFLLNVVAIVSMLYWSDREFSGGTILAVLWIVAVFLTRPFRNMPWFFTFMFDSWTSVKRIANYLKLENIVHDERFSKDVVLQPLKSDSKLKVKNLNLKIGEDRILKNINLEIGMNEFICIVGEVGSGKSLLLLSLLGETSATFDEFWIGDNNAKKMPVNQLRSFFSFVPQEGFVMSSSVRDNVAFDYDFNQDQDKQILESLEKSQFAFSSERMADGLETEIGERGVNLSGGQRQRVNLARADFHFSPFLLLDDSLSAVDVDTEKKLVKTLFDDRWKNRTRVLTTHRLTVLDKADRVIFLKDGLILAEGTFFDLMESIPEFREYVSTVMEQKAEITQPHIEVPLPTADEKSQTVGFEHGEE